MNSKRKGNAGELELLHILQQRGIKCKRNEQGLLAGFAGGFANPDIEAVLNDTPIHIECKRVERLNLTAAMEQAERDAACALPIVMHRQNRRPWAVSMRLSDFLTLLHIPPTSAADEREDTNRGRAV